MTSRRLMLGAVALGLVLFAAAASESLAQPNRGGDIQGPADGYDCPSCSKVIDTPDGVPPATCPHCKAKLTSTKNADGTYTLTFTETNENKWKKPLLYGGGGLLVLGLIALALKHTVFKPAPVKKKKKKRDFDDDDRPRKKNRPVLDEDDDRPRKKSRPMLDDDDRPRKPKKPRIVEED